MTDDPLAPLRRLRRRYQDEAAARGLILSTWGVHPGAAPGDPDVVTVIVEADTAAMARSPEQLAIDAQVEEIEVGEANAAREQAVAESLARLRGLFESGGDLLGPDPS